MKKSLDKFSAQSKLYKKFRPKYPKELYYEILKYVENKEVCWDCGTGNGQVACELSRYFKKVYATDISQQQIEKAEKRENITYRLERAEKTSFDDNTFDLITVGQAIHWFDLNPFNQEVKRVSKNRGIIGVWGYGLLRITKDVDEIIDEFYYKIIGNYWNAERKHVDHKYEAIPFDFNEKNLKKSFSIKTNWDLNHLEGYLNSWSSVQNYQFEHKGENPVNELMDKIKSKWKVADVKSVNFPLFVRIGRIIK